MIEIGIIGGSGLYNLEEMTNKKEVAVKKTGAPLTP